MLPQRQPDRPRPEGQGDGSVRHQRPKAVRLQLFPRPGPRSCCGGELHVHGVCQQLGQNVFAPLRLQP